MLLDTEVIDKALGSVGAKAEIIYGDLFISNLNRGLILKAANGNCYRLKIDYQGKVKSHSVPCPN